MSQAARLVTGGKRLARDGFYLEPTVFADVTDDMVIAREEIFGPVMAVLDFENENEVMARANDTEFGLAAGVFTRDLARALADPSFRDDPVSWVRTASPRVPSTSTSSGRRASATSGSWTS